MADWPTRALLRSRRFRLESDGVEDVAYQLDGDFAGTLPVDVELLPGQLRLLCLAEAAARLGFGFALFFNQVA